MSRLERIVYWVTLQATGVVIYAVALAIVILMAHYLGTFPWGEAIWLSTALFVFWTVFDLIADRLRGKR